MTVRDLLIDPAAPPLGPESSDRVLAFVDLDIARCDRWRGPLPHYPVIGLGRASHPLAAQLDAVVEAPVSADGLLGNVHAAPVAAAVAMQLLRSIEGLAYDRALMMESLAYAVLQGSQAHARWLGARALDALPEAPGRVLVARDGPILRIVLDRPLARNAIDRPMRDALFAAFGIAALDRDVARVVLRSTGPTFSIGADLAEFGTTRDPARAHLIRMVTLPAWQVALRPDILDVHVEGACIGAALEIAAFAGRLTAAPGAWFQLPELAMGVIPGAGGCVSVSRRIGRQRSALMILSGRRISAETALRWGLIDAIEDQPPIDPGASYSDLR